jgi:hypothetical protein
MKKDNWKSSYKDLLLELKQKTFEIADCIKNKRQLSEDDVKSYHVIVTTLILLLISGLRFKQRKNGVECKFKRWAKYPNSNEFSELYSAMSDALTMLNMLQRIHGIEFSKYDINQLKDLNDVRKHIDDLMIAQLSSKDFAYIYQLRIKADKSIKTIIALSVGVVIVSAILIGFFIFNASNDDSDFDDGGEPDFDDGGEPDFDNAND